MKSTTTKLQLIILIILLPALSACSNSAVQADTGGQPANVVTSFQTDEEMAEAPAYIKELLLEGEYIRCDPARADVSGIYSSGLFLKDVLEVGNKLFFLWHHMNEGSAWVEAVSPETGEAAVVWDQKFPEGHGAIMLAATDYGKFDYRIKCSSMVVYKNSENPAAEQVFEIPIDLSDIESRYISFDVYPETGQIAYSTDDGVFAGTESGVTALHKNSELKQYASLMPGTPPPYYTEVHFINSGMQLVSRIIKPDSQSGLVALVITDIDDGKHYKFEDLFSAMIADVRYKGDTTVAAFAYGHVTIIDAKSKQTEIIPSFFDAVRTTYDFYNYFDVRQNKDEKGAASGFLVSFTVDEPALEKRLLKITGENAHLSKVTERYAILICRDSKDAYIALAPIRF